mgnify:CR=1 FL=1
MGYINMKKFNKDKYLKKLRFKKYKRYLYMGIPCILVLLMGIYFAYSKFSVFKEEEVVRTTVGDFISGDVVVGAYIDGEYSKSIPGKNDGYIVDKIVCDNDASASWNNDSWGIVLTNLTKRTKCNVYFNKIVSVSEKVTTAMNNNPSMFASDDPDNNVRYIGADPSNYVFFNCSDYNNQTADTCELWRIIGVFNNVTKGDDSKENLVKIIRADSLGDYSWDYKKTGVGTSTTDSGSNDWTDSQLMMMLNLTSYLKSGYTNSSDIISSGSQQLYSKMGSYYNGTKGCRPKAIASGSSFSCTEVDFTSTGLKNDTTRNAIEEVVWNLGSTSSYISASNGLASHWYGYERGTTVYSGNATTWKGKIGLMYPSDYGYATSGGTTKDRNVCLAKELYNWDSSDFSDCKENDYLYNSSLYQYQWTLAPYSADSDGVFAVRTVGSVYDRNANLTYAVHPVLFLKSNVLIKSGTGESSNPYQLKLGID